MRCFPHPGAEPGPARGVAGQLFLLEVEGGLLPQHRAEVVRRLEARGEELRDEGWRRLRGAVPERRRHTMGVCGAVRGLGRRTEVTCSVICMAMDLMQQLTAAAA